MGGLKLVVLDVVQGTQFLALEDGLQRELGCDPLTKVCRIALVGGYFEGCHGSCESAPMPTLGER